MHSEKCIIRWFYCYADNIEWTYIDIEAIAQSLSFIKARKLLKIRNISTLPHSSLTTIIDVHCHLLTHSYSEISGVGCLYD